MAGRVLVLSGGGSLGAWQVGALKRLSACGWSPDLVAGTSVGALNGLVLATHRRFAEAVERLESLWLSIAGPERVYVPWGVEAGLAGDAAQAVVGGHSSVWCSQPLGSWVHEVFDQGAIWASRRKLVVTSVSLTTGQLHRWRETSPHLERAVWASASYPWFFEPVEICGELHTDGGLREVVPVEEAFSVAGPDAEVIVLCCSPLETFAPLPYPLRLWDHAFRCIEIQNAEVVRGDLAALNRAGVRSTLLMPPAPLGDSRAFDPAQIRAWIAQGEADARRLP